MNEKLRISYENIGSSGYIAVTFPKDEEIIGYQLEMISANEIKHTLPASKRMVNGETVVYYNISSKTPLSMLLTRNKLKRGELIALIKGIAEAVQDGREYQLSESGYVMEPDYIYVDADTYSPYFMYLPMKNSKSAEVRELLTSLIVRGKIEITNDNFIQVLLEALNTEPFSLEKIEEVINRYSTPVFTTLPADGLLRKSPLPQGPKQEIPWQENLQQKNILQEMPFPERLPQARKQTVDIGQSEYIRSQSMEEKTDKGISKREQIKLKKKEKKQKREEKENITRRCENSSPEREKAKKKFLIPQAVIMVFLAAMLSFGAFKTPEGGLAIKNILGVILVLAVAEIIIYREAYVNSGVNKSKRKNEEKGKAEKKDAKADNKRPKPAGFKSVKVPERFKSSESFNDFEGPGTPENMKMPEIHESVNTENRIREEISGELNIQSQQQINPQPSIQPQLNPQLQSQHDDDENGETELWDYSTEGEAYLEYYVNGVMTRVPLDKQSVLIGRLSRQVDFAVANPNVGKIHAEFINMNGNIYVKDLNSKNGTYINRNGQRINSNVPYPLKDNDRISLADSEFTLRCAADRS